MSKRPEQMTDAELAKAVSEEERLAYKGITDPTWVNANWFQPWRKAEHVSFCGPASAHQYFRKMDKRHRDANSRR